MQVSEAPATASSRYAYGISAAAALAGLLFGFDTAVINGALVFLKQQWGWTGPQLEAAAGALLVGCLTGSGVAGSVTDRWGRRKVLIAAALAFCGSSVWTALPHGLSEFIAARFCAGLAIGIASVLAPMYIAEVAPPSLRGRLVTLNQMAIVTGIVLSYFVNWLLSGLGESSWRWMFATATIPSVGFLLALLRIPESPRWLVSRQRPEEAESILARIGGPAEAQRQMEEIRDSLRKESGSVWTLFRPPMRHPLLLGVVLAVFSQVTGINTVLYYGALLFQQHGGRSGASDAIGANVLIGLVNFAMTIVAIAWVDKFGRRPLLLGGIAGMIVALVALCYSFTLQPPPANLILGTILLYVASFAVSLGPGTWLYLSEIFPTEVRGRAMSVATLSLWSACTLVTMTFLSLTARLGPAGAFGLYATMCVGAWLFIFFLLPETKGRTLEEISQSWCRRKR